MSTNREPATPESVRFDPPGPGAPGRVTPSRATVAAKGSPAVRHARGSGPINENAPEGATPAFLVERSGKRHSLKGQTVIGRDEAVADVALSEASISRRHAWISWDSMRGGWVLHDLGSLNGTFVDWRPVKSSSVVLRDKQTLRFGRVTLVFCEGRPKPAPLRSKGLWVSRSTGRGGLVGYGETSISLDEEEFTFVWELARKRLLDTGVPEARRGFVRDLDLAHAITGGVSPNLSAVRPIAMRACGRLFKLGIIPLIEISDTAGYRLRYTPAMEGGR